MMLTKKQDFQSEFPAKPKKKQIEEAIKENNQERIELLTVPVPQRLSAKHWNKIIKKWKDAKLINYEHAIPLLPETNSNSLNEIKNDDLSTYSLMLKQLNYQLQKIEIQIKYAKLTKDKAQKKAEAENTPVSGKPLQEILQGFTASLTETEQHNNKLLLLATRIYGSTQNQTEVIYNITTIVQIYFRESFYFRFLPVRWVRVSQRFIRRWLWIFFYAAIRYSCPAASICFLSRGCG